MTEREYLIQQLCHQIMGLSQRDGDPRPTPGIQDVASGNVRVDIELRGMVHSMRRQIWIDQGEWTSKIIAEIERQAAEVDIGALIERRVKAELTRTVGEIESLVQKEISNYIASAVYDRVEYLKETIHTIAQKLVDGIRKAAAV